MKEKEVIHTKMGTPGIEDFSKRLDEIFEQGMPTKAQILDAYNKYAFQQPEKSVPLTAEEILETIHQSNYDIYGSIECRIEGAKWLRNLIEKQIKNGR